MMGYSHGVSGHLVGALTLPIAPVDGIVEQVAWIAVWGGFALWPDLDSGGWSMRGPIPRGHGSTVARMWGPITISLSWLVGVVARGHRNGTHDPVLAPLVFGAIAFAASLNRWSAMAVLAVAIGVSLHAAHKFIPGGVERTWHGNLLLSWGSAWWLSQTGLGSVAWMPYAVAGGCLVHILGDALTHGGIPVPFTWIDGSARRMSLRLFRTGATVETVLIAPACTLGAVALTYLFTPFADVGAAIAQALST